MTNEDYKEIIKTLQNMVAELKNMSGVDKKDAAFLQEMIAHHQAALKMSKPLLKSDRLGKFAQGIIDAQSKEIEQMKKWLKAWFDMEPTSSDMHM